MTTIAQERSALAKVGGPRLRRREEWGARFGNYGSSRPVTEPAPYQFVHVTVTNPRNYSSDDRHAQAIEAIGISRFPATGISYSRLSMMSAAVYEAQPIGRRGAHTVNDKKLSKCSMSGCPSRGGSLSAPSYNFNVNARAYAIAQNVGDPVSDRQLDALARIMAADRIAGFVRKDAAIHGHRCVAWKDCPGGKMWARMGELRMLVDHYLRVGLGGATPTPEDDMPYTKDELVQVSADGFLRAVRNSPLAQDAFKSLLDAYFIDRLNPSRPSGVHRVLTWFRVAPWHQLLGRSGVSMHQVMGELRAAVTGSLPDLIREAGDEVGLTPEQITQLADSVAAKVERVTVVVEDGS